MSLSITNSNLTINYYQSAQSAASVGGTNSIGGGFDPDHDGDVHGAGGTGSADKASLSPRAQLLNNLQQLQQQDPTKFKDILSQISSQLSAAAQQQTGNTNASNFLNGLASQFQQAAQTGSLSSLQQGVPGHHGHRHHAQGASSYNSAGQTQATSATSTSSSQDPLQALFNTIQTEVSQALNPTTAASSTTSTGSSTTQPTVSVTA